MITRRGLAAASAVLAAPPVLRAQTAWPGERPIEVIVPYPPGGGVDVMARLTLPFVAKHLPGARFVVANRAGAGGQVGFEATFNAAPDGYTLGAVAVPALNSFPVERPVRYRPMEFTFLANVVYDPNTIFVGRDSPFRTLKDLIDAAKARPGQLHYGTTGIGSDDHILMLWLEDLARVEPMVHVPFQGFAPMLSNVLGGHIQVAVGNVSEILAAMRDGRVHSLGQAATERWSEAADVPTFREQGFDITGGSSRGIVGPPGIAEPIVRRLEEAFRATFIDPDFRRDAARATLPLRLLVGAEYRAMIAETDQAVRDLFRQRPWGR
ncbi:tripartite tricarboxylate transporter substrate binding protein [Elioraea tepidiphila]|jgi:tripartite-type tricarboxylate transporter receptor subunit TctC|uniref:Bug family tripartite tricarboxylate transporter substrate binding protein n=1 Tax=Elioraea tepidiphila TaxID=457934 RepID=UPI00036C5E9C|nr:tripartite tricarboxylate transporter substrate binding protein [Elioraea tepidiphila]